MDMDRRSWLWRRMSSKKNLGEIESSGSMSSHSERFSDDQITAALLNSSAKEDLAKQHAKVAEEAVSGWEKAENELLILKQQLDNAKQENSVLEDQFSHLNDALKECMRDLQQAKEEQERDLSTQAAEAASRQHLESIKKVAKLKAECRRLKAMARKTLSANDHRSVAASSVYVESFTDSMSDIGERQLVVESDMQKLGGWDVSEGEPNHHDSWPSALIKKLDQFNNENTAGKNSMVFSTEMNLMDDFLEMERLVALPDTESNAEVEAIAQKNAALEKKLEKMEAEKLELEMDLTECEKQLQASLSRIKEVELEVVELQTKLALANKSNEEPYEKLKATHEKKEIDESKLRVAHTEAEELVLKICSLEEEIEKERALSAENLAKCGKLEDELLRIKNEAQLQKDTEIFHGEGVNREGTSIGYNCKFAECQKTIESLGLQLKSLATLEDFLLDSESPMELACEVTPGVGISQVGLHDLDEVRFRLF
ncbi:Filament-like plant protein [Glycine soja]|uniref:Filament-like plant protein n=1 Tax=Glycine soja TaxID=3848 RepID=A0A445GX98_GLYSO|nr:Filament-like plant protein [Glycine soja]